jgi:3-aminobutyryl-CoA ammonia-lyase
MKRQVQVGEKISLRFRVSEEDVHYAGGLVAGSYILGLFGDVGTELVIRFDGDEGLLAGYNSVKLTSPIAAGNYLEVVGWISKEGDTSRIIKLEAYRYIKLAGEPHESSADYLSDPELVAQAEMVIVVPKECQRYKG